MTFSATTKLRVLFILALYTLPNPPYPTTEINSKFYNVISTYIVYLHESSFEPLNLNSQPPIN